MSFNRKISSGMFFAALAFLISIVISFYTYRFLWIYADREFFAAWLAVFEFAQFLLLLDLGFTHSFIKKHINSESLLIEADIPSLRGALLIVALIAVVIVLLSVWQLGLATQSSIISYLFLGLSIGVTLLGYADTAVLRIKNQFKKLYVINIFCSLIFMLFLMFGSVDDVVQRLAIATFIRSALQFALQSLSLGIGIKIEKPNHLIGSGAVVALNASYFLFFMLDAFIMTAMGVPLVIVATVLALKKYYDALRGLWDSTLGVASIAFAKFDNNTRDWIIRGGVIISYACAWLLSGLMIHIWLGENNNDVKLSVGICLSVMSLSLYRVETTRLYFQGALGFLAPIAVALVVKGIFSFLIYLRALEIWEIYLVQGLLVGCSIFVINFLDKRRKA